MVNGLPSRGDITCDVIFVLGWNSCQEPVCKGNRFEKVVRKSLIDMVNLSSVKDLDAISAMLLVSPSMCTVFNGDDF